MTPPLWAITGVLAVVGGVATYVQSERLGAVQAEYEAFKTQIEVLGREAERKNREKEAKDLSIKEKADNERKILLADNASLARRLRTQRSDSRFVPPASALATSPSRACFDRTLVESALQRFDDEVTAIVGQGDVARIGLDNAKRWAAER